MDTSPENNNADTNRPGPFSAVLHSINSIVEWLDWLFTLTEEDRKQAGINLDGEGHEE